MKKFILLTSLLLTSCNIDEPEVIIHYEDIFHYNVNDIGKITYEEVECLAKNIYFEGRGESLQGQIAIAHVTLNRQKDNRFEDSICDVVYQGPLDNKTNPLRNQCQFSWWCDGRSDVPRDLWSWGRSINVAVKALQGEYKDPTNGALWFHSTKVNPDWNFKTSYVGKIDNHIFYR